MGLCFTVFVWNMFNVFEEILTFLQKKNQVNNKLRLSYSLQINQNLKLHFYSKTNWKPLKPLPNLWIIWLKVIFKGFNLIQFHFETPRFSTHYCLWVWVLSSSYCLFLLFFLNSLHKAKCSEKFEILIKDSVTAKIVWMI